MWGPLVESKAIDDAVAKVSGSDTIEDFFIEDGGAEHRVGGRSGESLMQVAVANLVPGIQADCGGLCSCATFHGYIDSQWLDKLPRRSQGEDELLASVSDLRPESRLTCQIELRADIDGIVVRLPASQY